jgi:aryl-alcohol dehydrogenase-like predicted oxidoreductase
MRSLNDIVRSGKVHYIAISDAPAWQVSRANMLASLRGWRYKINSILFLMIQKINIYIEQPICCLPRQISPRRTRNGTRIIPNGSRTRYGCDTLGSFRTR